MCPSLKWFKCMKVGWTSMISNNLFSAISRFCKQTWYIYTYWLYLSLHPIQATLKHHWAVLPKGSSLKVLQQQSYKQPYFIFKVLSRRQHSRTSCDIWQLILLASDASLTQHQIYKHTHAHSSPEGDGSQPLSLSECNKTCMPAAFVHSAHDLSSLCQGVRSH